MLDVEPPSIDLGNSKGGVVYVLHIFVHTYTVYYSFMQRAATVHFHLMIASLDFR